MKDEERTDRWIDDLESNLATARELASRGRSAFERDPALQLAFEALSNRVGDLAKKLTAADPTRFSDPVWSQAAKNRDFVVRHYGRVDLNILWQTVAIDFSKLVTPKATVAKRDLGPGAVDIATSPITTASQRARRRG